MTDRDILPDSVRPSHYALSIRELDFKNWSYKGTVTIDVAINKPVKEITLNTHQLVLNSASVAAPSSDAVSSTSFSYDEKRHRATIALSSEVAPAPKASLTIEFQGNLNNDLAGFYRSKYKPVVTPVPASVPRDDDFHYMFATQFEACDARRAFPCWDEPNIKASFDFEIEIPDDLVALSNMDAKAERKSSRDGYKVVSFSTTPIMSTYLLAWAVGDFEYVEAFTERRYNGKQIPVRVYTTRGLKEQGRWALQHAGPILDFFSETFGIDYPLPKSDLLCVHEFASGAMENWGLVTYRTTALLFDEKTSDTQFKNRVAYVVAHELAHQWFGNLVTMDWWDELWLNEGFATWVGWHAIDHLHPEWDVWSQFVKEGMGSAFSLDGIRASHPIHVPIYDALEVDQIFDNISYLKGCATIRMLADHLGNETFLKGVALYLKRHMYGNAKTSALWEALAEVSGKPIADLIGFWVSKIGYPVVTVAEEPGQISVKQNRFLTTGDVKPHEDETIWNIPLALRGKKGVDGVLKQLLTTREDTIRDIDDEFYTLNTGSPGFYLVNYPPPRLLKLGTQLSKLSVEDKIGTIGSASDLAYAGYSTTPALLSFLQGFGGETDQLVWGAALGAIARVKSIFGGDEDVKKALEKYTLKLIGDAVTKIGLDFPEGEDYHVIMLRKLLVSSASSNGHPEVKAELLRQFEAWVKDPTASPIQANLRSPVFRAAIREDAARVISILKSEWFTTQSIDGKSIILGALGSTRDEELVKREILPFLYNTSPPAPASESVPVSDMYQLGSSINSNRYTRGLQWQYLKENWEQVSKKFGHPLMLDRFLGFSLTQFVDIADAEDIQKFFADKDTKAFERTLKIINDRITARALYRERDAAKLKEWLAQNGYA
jgi:aminopeptidase N